MANSQKSIQPNFTNFDTYMSDTMLNINDKAMNKRETVTHDCSHETNTHETSTVILNVTMPYLCNNTISSFLKNCKKIFFTTFLILHVYEFREKNASQVLINQITIVIL